jgi:hypothetical protein
VPGSPRRWTASGSIANLVDTGYGGRITKRYLTRLTIARRTP